MIGEIDIYGVFVPILLVWGLIALVLTSALRWILTRVGFYRLVWHRPLVDLSLFVLIMAAVAVALPSWIAS
jgi:hypothetical protein